MDVICIYQHALPFESTALESTMKKRKQLWSKLDELLRTMPVRSSVVLAGDFNSNLCSSSPYVGHSVIHNPARPAVVEERKWLTGMLVSHRLAALNSWSKKQCTYSHPSGSSQIDWILVRSALADEQAKSCHPLHAPIAGWRSSGHRMLRATIPLRWQPWKQSRQVAHKCQSHAAAAAGRVEDQAIESLRAEVKQVAVISVQPLVRPGIVGVDGEILHFWEARRTLARHTALTMRDIFVRMRMVLQLQKRRRELQAQIRANKRRQLLETLHLAEVSASTGNSKGLFQCVRWLAPKTLRRSIRLRTAEGTLMHPREECDMLADYAVKLFTAQRATDVALVDLEPLDPAVFEPDAWIRALSSLRAGKAVPQNSPAIHQWQASSEIVAHRLSAVATQTMCSQQPRVPRSWTEVQLAWLAKAGKTPSSPQNLRTIGLMPGDTKAFLIVLRDAVAPYIQECLFAQPQYAYRKGASTADALMRAAGHCFSVRALLQRHRRDHTSKLLGDASAPLKGGLMCGLDLQKAFDALPHSELHMAMIEAGDAMKELRTLIEALLHLGMAVNFQKSLVVLRVCGTAVAQLCKSCLVWRNGTQHLRIRCHDNDMYIPCATSMPYLGATLSYDNFELQTYKTRSVQARSRFQELKRVLRTNGALAERHRVRLYKAIIWPTLWYALSSVGVTCDVLRGVCSLLAMQLRKVLRIHEQGISNKVVLKRAGIDPRTFFQLQVQRKGEAIISDVHRADRIKVQESKHCYRIHQRLLGLEDSSAMTSLVRIPKVDAVAVPCPVCGVYFDSQASLQMHIAHKHKDVNKLSRLPFRRDLHALHGLPICRFCQVRLHDWRSLEKHITGGTCPRVKEFIAQGRSEDDMIAIVTAEEKRSPPVPPAKATSQAVVQDDINIALEVEPCTLATRGSLLRVLATRCALCRQLITDSSKMKTHWQRTHSKEWQMAHASALSGSQSLSATFCTPCVYCGSKARNPRDHSGKCTSMFQLLAMRELRGRGHSTPEPSRGPSVKQSTLTPQYQLFDLAETPLGRYFKTNADAGNRASSSLAPKALLPNSPLRSEVVAPLDAPDRVALPAHWLTGLVLGNPHNHCYMNASLFAVLHAMQVSGSTSRALQAIRELCQGFVRRGSVLCLAAQLVLRAYLRQWSFDDRQHDAAEFTLVLLSSLGLSMPAWEARFDTPEGTRVRHAGGAPIALTLRSEACSLQTLLEDWSAHELVTVHALTSKDGPVLLHLARNADAFKNQVPISIASIIRVPVFVEGTRVVWTDYQVCSIVEHLGEAVTSGHYRSVLKMPDGWMLTDDHRTSCSVLWSVQREELMYLVWLIPAQSLGNGITAHWVASPRVCGLANGIGIDPAMEGSEEWSFFRQYMPAGLHMQSGPPSDVSTAATGLEERETKAARYFDAKGVGGRGKGSEAQQGHPGSSKDGQVQQDDWFNAWGRDGADGFGGSSAELREMRKVIGMMQKLILRHEDSINILKLEYSFVAHMRLNVPSGVATTLYVAADGWRKLKASEPTKLDRPMRTSLFVCFLAELKSRLTGLDERPDDAARMEQMGWIATGPPRAWHFLKWDGAAQRTVVDQSKPALTQAEVLEHIDILLKCAVVGNALTRFHPTRPLAEDMQGESLAFLVQVGTMGEASLSMRLSLKALCHNAALQLVIQDGIGCDFTDITDFIVCVTCWLWTRPQDSEASSREDEEVGVRAEDWHAYMLGVAQLNKAMCGGGGSRRRNQQRQEQGSVAHAMPLDDGADDGQDALASALNEFLTTWCKNKPAAKPQHSLAHQLKDLLQPLIQQRASDEQVAQKVKALLTANQKARRLRHTHEAVRPSTQAQTGSGQLNQPSRRVEFAVPASALPARSWTPTTTKASGADRCKERDLPDGSRTNKPTQEAGLKKSITAVVPSEWTAVVKLTTVAGVRKALASGSDLPGNLVVVSGVEQYLELRDQFAAVACYSPLAVIIDDPVRHQAPGLSEVKVSVKRGSAALKTETLMLACIPDGAAAPRVKPAVRIDVAKYQPAAKVTVRVSAPSHYRQLFRDRWDTAQTVVTEVAQWQDGPVSALLGGQWNWVTTKGTHHLVAHLRVPPSVADQLISKSGRNGILVTKAGVADKAPPQAMLWLKKEDNEDAECYFRRALSTANTRNQSLKIRAGGGNDLGVLRLETDGVPHSPIVIEAQTPRLWEREDVVTFLSDQGWQDVTVFGRRKKNRFHVVWTVRGLSPVEEKLGPWHYVDRSKPDLQVYATKTVYRGAKATEVFAVSGPGKKLKTEHKPDAPPSNTGGSGRAEDAHDARRTPQRDASEILEARDADADVENEERDRSPRRVKEASAEPEPFAEDEITHALRNGWVRVDQKGTGDCAFRCVAAARHYNSTGELLSEEASRREGGLIRGMAVGHIRSHEETYLPYFAKDQDNAPEEPDPSQGGIAQTFQEWLAQMATPHCWTDGLTLQGIASKLGLALVIWVKTPEQTWKRVCLAQSFGKDRGSGRFAQMAKDQQAAVLLLENGHYTWLQPKAEDRQVPRQWLRESVVPPRLQLAGGGSQASDCDFRLDEVQAPATPSVHSLSPEPDKAAQNAQALQALLQGTGAARAPSDLSQTGVEEEQAERDWECPLCFKGLPPAGSDVRGRSQTLAVWVSNTLFITFYAPPGDDSVAANLLCDFHTSLGAHRDSWLCVGDANGEPNDCDISYACSAVGGHLVTDCKPTRWKSERCIDWYCTNRPERLRWFGHLEAHLSDHVVLAARWEAVECSTLRGRLQPKPTWRRPDSLTAEVWKRKLSEAWLKQKVTAAGLRLDALLADSANLCVQEEWDLYMALLAATYKSAIEACLIESSGSLADEARSLLKQTGARSNCKGALAVHQTLPREHWGPGPAARSMADVRVSKKLARLYQLQRLLAPSQGRPRQQELQALQAKTGVPAEARTPAQQLAWTKAQIRHLTAQRVASEEAAKTRRLRDWRTKVAQSDRALSRWFKAKESSQWHLTVKDSRGQLCDTPEAAATAIASHWRAVAQDSRCSDKGQAAKVLEDGFRLPHGRFVPEDPSFGEPAGTSWPGPDLAGLTRAFRKCKGSAGIDGWCSSELKHDTTLSAPLTALDSTPQGLPPQLLQAAYMDDRTAVSQSWAHTEAWVAEWQAWSSVVGLKENSSKTQVCAKYQRFRDMMSAQCPQQWQRSECEVLGASTVCSYRQNTEAESNRLMAAKARQVMLRTAWLAWPRFIRASRSWCVSKAAYGWVGRLPPLAEAQKLFGTATVASATCRMANRHLRAAAYGAILHLDCVVPSGLLSKITKVLSLERQGYVPAGDRLWASKPGSSVHVFKKWMSKRSWNVVRPWVWQSDLVASYRIDLSVGSRQSRSVTLHNFRQNWRLHQLLLFLRGDRHEAREMLTRRTETQLLQDAEQVDFAQLRSLLLERAEHRTIMLGALVSPAWLAACEGSNAEHHCCPRCGMLLAPFQHVAYDCVGKPRPQNEWQARFGWPLCNVPKAVNAARLQVLADTCRVLWEQRHPSAN
ncbi:L96 [Symbiodinium sp. CCMP2592]|nr:L96 [Symbiodinium sp. CCMP2592]